MARTTEQIAQFVREVRLRNYARDQRMSNVRSVRAGEVQRIMPGMLPDEWPKSIVANTIDISARFTAEQTGIMPVISCTSGIMTSDRQKKYAQKRTLIANHYAGESRIHNKLVEAADWYDSFGFVPLLVEPHFGDAYCQPGPRIRFENPMGCYFDSDSYGRTRVFVKVYDEEVSVLAARFPHLAAAIVTDRSQLDGSLKIEMVLYMDDDQSVIYLPQRNNLVIHQMANPMKRLMVFIAERSRFDPETRGAYDDVVWIQLARARFAMLGLEAAKDSVYAPLSIPTDVQKISLGPKSVIRTNNPEKVRRVGMEMSPAAFQVGELLNNEVMVGSRFPEGATGKSPGSIVTGAAVDALNGTIDTKVRTAQANLGLALQDALSACFEMDDKFFPRVERSLRVRVNGTTYEETYRPTKDIAGIYQVDVTYGMTAGMDVNRALVFLLQLRGDKDISRDFLLRNMPFDINIDQEMEKIQSEELDDALMQGIMQLGVSMGALVAQGQDPVSLVTKIATIGKEREKGTPLRDAVLKAFQPQVPPPGSVQPGAGGPGVPGAPTAPPAPGAAPGGGAQPPGAQPGGGMDISSMLAGLTGGGAPNLQANVSRKAPISG
jgi:hypothetical protein